MENKEHQYQRARFPSERGFLSLLQMIERIQPKRLAMGIWALEGLQISLKQHNGPVDNQFKKSILKRFKNMEGMVSEFELGNIEVKYELFRHFVKSGKRVQALGCLYSIEDIVLHELSSSMCYVVPKADCPRLNGDFIPIEVQLHFPKCVSDLAEAGRCVVFGLNTACMCHCFLALEKSMPKIVLLDRSLKHHYDTKVDFM